MREIKFRRPHFRFTDGGFEGFSYWGPVSDGFNSPASWSHCKYGDDQQFTGLLDKSGVEIYEGDIVHLSNGEIVSVVFQGGAFEIASLIESNGYGDEYLGYYAQNGIEVIGNIYENPELLKDESC